VPNKQLSTDFMEESVDPCNKQPNRELAKVAIEAAYRKLESQEGWSWIHESGLRLRAFFWGVYAAVEPFADEQQLRTLFLRSTSDTMFQRDADRPREAAFEKSRSGQALEHLRMLCSEGKSSPEQLEDAIEAVRKAVESDRSLSMQLFDDSLERVAEMKKPLGPEVPAGESAGAAKHLIMNLLEDIKRRLLICWPHREGK
jgi:hypothetical protein